MMRINSQWQSKESSSDFLELLDTQWEDYDDFVRKYDSTVNQDNYSKRARSFNMFNEIGYYVNQNLIDIETVFDITGGHAPFLLWNKFKPIFEKQREVHKDPNRQKWYEYLITELSKERVKRGLPPDIYDADNYYTQE